MHSELDSYDRKILAALQRDGRLSNVQLAEEIGLSPSPCLRRVRMLEEAGVIERYVALVDPAKVALGLTPPWSVKGVNFEQLGVTLAFDLSMIGAGGLMGMRIANSE